MPTNDGRDIPNAMRGTTTAKRGSGKAGAPFGVGAKKKKKPARKAAASKAARRTAGTRKPAARRAKKRR
jgi:hypothetical protein